MAESKNKPLSCTRGMHFFKKVSVVDQCMYCGAMFFNGMLIHQGNIDLDKVVVYTAPPRVGKTRLAKIIAGEGNYKINKRTQTQRRSNPSSSITTIPGNWVQ